MRDAKETRNKENNNSNTIQIMAKSSASSSSKNKSNKKASDKKDVKKKNSTSSPSKKKRKAVEVVVCPSAFPDFQSIAPSSKRTPRKPNTTTNNNSKELYLDMTKTTKEIQSYAIQGYTKSQKRSFLDAEYSSLTGRSNQKKQKMPIQMVAGLRKAAKKREEKQRMEAREAGIILSSKKNNGDDDRSRRRLKGFNAEGRTMEYKNTRIHGPAPSVGFMKGGVLRVSNPPPPSSSSFGRKRSGRK